MKGLGPILFLAAAFLLVNVGALAISTVFPNGSGAFDDPSDPVNSLFYLVMIVAMTGVVLLLIRIGVDFLVKALFGLSFLIALFYAIFPLTYIVTGNDIVSLAVGGGLSTMLLVVMFLRPTWWLLDAIGILVAMAVATLIGISLSLIPVLLLLVALAAYDAWAVYRTRHMLALAEGVARMKLPIMLIAPKRGKVDMERIRNLDVDDGDDRDVVLMGVGDVVIPSILTVSAYRFLDPTMSSIGNANLIVALCTMIGALLGLFLLMRIVMRGRPQAGLPILNGGAIIGFLIGYALTAL